jgi:hypothetical protein
MPYHLKNRNVLVTGGSAYVLHSPFIPRYFTFCLSPIKKYKLIQTSGLGEAICYSFAAQGANIAINYFNRFDPAEQVRKKCEEKYGVKAVLVKAVSKLFQNYIPSHPILSNPILSYRHLLLHNLLYQKKCTKEDN